MVSYQRKEYTIGNVMSISKALPENATFIICDNGSTDGTREWLEANQEKYGYILWLSETNLRVGGAWKYLANKYEDDDFDYILCLDNDHWLYPNPNFFEECLEVFDLDKDISSLGLLGRRMPGHFSNETAYDKNYDNRKEFKGQEYFYTDLYAGCRLDKFNLWRNTMKDWKNNVIANKVCLAYQAAGKKTVKLNPGHALDISQYNFNNPNHDEYNKWFFAKEKPKGRFEKKQQRGVSDDETRSLVIDRFGQEVADVLVPEPKNEVDVVLISWAKDEKLQQVTEDAINSLVVDTRIHLGPTYHIYVVETNKDVNYDKFKGMIGSCTITTIYPDVPFGYHRYLNIGRRAGKSKYVALCNNDLTFEPGWASEMIRVMEMHPQMKSASPWCPQTQGSNKSHLGSAHVGYTVRKELAGWCIFQQRDIYDTYPNGELDEAFEFWFCDNDYGMTLQKAGIKHLLVPSSVVNHHDGNLGKTGNSAIDNATKQQYTMGQQQTFKNKWG